MVALSVLGAAEEEPYRLALIAAGVPFTYAEIAARVRRILGWLDTRAGLSNGVAVVPRLDVDSVCLLLALIERRVTIAVLHPRLTEIERNALLAHAAPDLAIVDVASAVGEALRSPPLQKVDSGPVDDERTLAIVYTSGTTGTPKGAMLSARAFRAAAAASAQNLGWRNDDRWLLAMPLSHVGGLSILVRALIARRCVVIPEAKSGFAPDEIRHVMTRDRVTLASFVPTMLKRFTESPEPLPKSVRAILLGGAGAPAPLLDEARRRQWPVLTTYGLTEACSQVTTQRYGSPPGAEQGSGPPIDGLELRIDEADGGRIELRGPTLMTGYYRHAESPFLADGFLRTEDFGRVDERGRLHVLGRRQELLVTGGENVYPLEVESALESIDGIDAACVFGIPDEAWGDLICAALVLKTARPLGEVKHAIAEILAPHKRPRRVALLPRLPQTPVGKLDRRATAATARPLLIAL